MNMYFIFQFNNSWFNASLSHNPCFSNVKSSPVVLSLKIRFTSKLV